MSRHIPLKARLIYIYSSACFITLQTLMSYSIAGFGQLVARRQYKAETGTFYGTVLIEERIVNQIARAGWMEGDLLDFALSDSGVCTDTKKGVVSASVYCLKSLGNAELTARYAYHTSHLYHAYHAHHSYSLYPPFTILPTPTILTIGTPSTSILMSSSCCYSPSRLLSTGLFWLTSLVLHSCMLLIRGGRSYSRTLMRTTPPSSRRSRRYLLWSRSRLQRVPFG